MDICCKIFQDRDHWLAARGQRIGGSECAALLGLHPYMTNVDLWRYKAGFAEPPAVDNAAVQYGAAAEEYIRGLFALDNPEYQLVYHPNNIWTNDAFPFAHASLDGWLWDKDRRLGVWECKTAEIHSAAEYQKWDGRIPKNYYCQLLWYLAVTGAEFAVLRAYLRGKRLEIKDYFFKREYAVSDIKMLMDTAVDFWAYVQDKRTPPLKLGV